ncbi:MAG: endonuclease/exonuclease/phosphatase family protein, partial [Rhodospirillaceae bacterium]|nr:endonuclease/exonuclease/phosphatase family protein [Rhodospirillaceae bacterium]
KGSARYHVIGTHAQFGWGAEQRTAKAAQFRAIRKFLEEQSGIPRSEPVIVGGDFNVLRHAFDGLLDDEALGVLAPTFRGHRFTREARSDWARRGNGYVDYVLAKKGWREPRYHHICPMVFRSLYDFEDRTLFSAVRGQGYCDLSDHWAVWGYFDYRDDATEPPDCPVPQFPPGSAPSMRR